MLISFCWRHLSKLNFEKKKKFDAIIKKENKHKHFGEKTKQKNNNTKVKTKWKQKQK